MKKILSARYKSKPYLAEFDKESLQLAIKRLNIINVMMLFLCAYLFYNDYFILKNVNNDIYRQNLLIIHFIFFATAISYLAVINFLKRLNHKNIHFVLWCLIHLFIIIGIALGMAISFNNAKVDFSIYTYITIIMFLSIFLPSKEVPTFIIVICMHMIFISSFSSLQLNTETISMNRVNSTVSVITSLVLYQTFSNYRIKGFIDDKRLKEQQDNLNRLFEINPLPLILISINKPEIIRMNDNAKKHFESTIENISEDDLSTYFLSDSNKKEIIERARLLKKSESQVMEISNNGKKTWIMTSYERVNYNGENCILVAITDITSIKMIENDLLKKASIDALTGVLNRAKGMEMLKNILHNKEFEFLAVVFCDIDELKTINDQYGHSEGDQLIYLVSEVISYQLDSEDFVFRYGGDEFVIVILNKQEKACIEKMHTMKSMLEQYQRLCKKPYKLSFSYGMKVIGALDENILEDIIGLADKSMYINKMKLKNVTYSSK